MHRAISIILILLVSLGISLADEQSPQAQPLSNPGQLPQIQFETNQGVITLELYPDKAPKTVQNILKYVKSGFYEGTIFHRVMDGFMIQGGGFNTRYERKETFEPIPNEANNGLKNLRGTIAMARTGDPHSATAQFFINVVDNFSLDHSAPTPRGWGYTVFGKVIKGMQVVDQIRKIPTGPGGPFPRNVPRTQIVINKATIVNQLSGG